ncbi:MAG TPA: cytochrome c [Woeseiaceae bacterium]|nr:cytochrome c [Woeseiaceae bacterium]
MRPALAAGLLALAACGGPGESGSEAGSESDSGADSAARNVPSAVRYDQYGLAGDLAPPAEDLVNPLIDEPNAAAQGEALFAAMNCDGCHGAGAVGFTAPSLVDGRWRYGGDDGALFHSIFYGRARGMPAYGGMLSDATVWQLVTFLRSQPVPDVVPTVAWP